MGQGYSMTTLSAASATIDVPELADLTHEKTLASARFMKSIRARSQQGYVFVKAVMKPYSSFQVQDYVRQITEERNILASIPNTLGYQRIVEVGSGGFLVRQYIFSSVYDRLSTRPFLEDIEKKWLAFQLLCAVRDCHAQNIYHGDIKTENLLVTSWNWLYLTDFSSSFKPTHLPEDNPADFSFYFDTSSRRTCYLAPERFTTSSVGDLQGELNWAMDIFSVGCAIAEIFLEGPIFSLSQIFKYRSGEYSPEHTHLNKIEDSEVKAMIMNMIELDPEKRYNAEQYLSFYRSKIFPEYFYSFLHQYMSDLTEPSAGRKPAGLDMVNLQESDNRIDRVYYDFDKISYFLGYDVTTAMVGNQKGSKAAQMSINSSKRALSQNIDKSLYDGTLLFSTIVVSSLRSTTKAAARLKACDLLVAFAQRLPDEAKLDRVLPYLMGLLGDQSDMVKVAALVALKSLFEMVEVISPINAFVFPEYIFPRLRQFVYNSETQPSPLVRAAYAASLSSLANSSARILDMVQAVRADGRLATLVDHDWPPDASYHALYDVARSELVPHFEDATVALITDPEPSVRRALLGSVSELCVFFGSSKASDVILTHLNTYLNDKDWLLRCSFYEAMVGVASYVGSSALERFILPIMVGSLTDSEPFVVEKVFRSLARMANMGLLQKSTTWELVSIAVRYLSHPSIWIRESAIQFIVWSSRYISVADKYCIIIPILQPYLKSQVLEISEDRILTTLKRPLSKTIFDAAVNWATRKGKSLFWTAASRDGVFTTSDPDNPQNPSMLTKRLVSKIPPSQKDKDDQMALESLKNLGLNSEDEMKLMGLREYILRIATHKPNDEKDNRLRTLNSIISLSQIDATPQNIFFDQREPVREVKSRPPIKSANSQKGKHTLADALLDASTTLNQEAKFQQGGRGQEEANGKTSSRNSTPIDIRDQTGTATQRLDLRINGRENSHSEISSNGRPSPSDLDKLSYKRDSLSGLRHRGSAISLMNRADSGKADPEISTSSETAFGRLDGPLHKRSNPGPSALAITSNVAQNSRSKSPAQELLVPAYEANHSYTGRDPHILKLLDNHFVENFPIDLLDFGQPRPSIDVKAPIKRATEVLPQANADESRDGLTHHNETWKPTGKLLTQFAEHTAPINRICASPDHAFFVTASDDGTCKIWDTSRLEKNITPRSRHTYRHATGSKVKSLCFVESTHTFISGANDGSIHAVKVDLRGNDGADNTKYGKPTLVRDYTIPVSATSDRKSPLSDSPSGNNSEYAVWLHHYRAHTSQSILLIATNRCRILAIDLKNMELIHSMENPIHHGTLTTFCVDKKHHWLLLGTSHGILDLWDLRFKLRLRSFGVQTNSRIERIDLHPTKGHGRWVIISSGNEICVWDIEKVLCKEVLRPNTFDTVTSSSKHYEAWYPDEEGSEKILARFAKDIKEKDESSFEPELRENIDKSVATPGNINKQTSNPSKTNNSIPALYILIDHLHNTAQPTNPNKTAILFSGGSDRALRYWDLAHPESSFIVSGPQLQSDDGVSILKPRYEISHPLTLSAGAQIGLIQERINENSVVSGTPRKKAQKQNDQTLDSPSKKKQKSTETGSGNTNSNNNTTGTISSNTTSKPPRNTVISAAASQLLKTHMDGIMDVIVLRKPYGCVVSVDRGGCIYVFH